MNSSGSGTDLPTASIVASVCESTGYEDCCRTRWSMACVQKGTEYARQGNLGDLCGREAWTQGPIPGTSQYYPRDFNLFSLGEVKDFHHAAGPVAAASNLSTTGFGVNWENHGPVGLVVGGNTTLSNGTVYGVLRYGGTYGTGPGVTYTKVPFGGDAGAKPGVPVAFSTVADKLGAMTDALKGYGGTVITSSDVVYSVLKVTGTDPELNVFAMSTDVLASVSRFSISMPQGASVIFNITGTNPVVQNMGFELLNGLKPERVLFNFPDAQSLTVQSVAVMGSILAPRATASLNWGDIYGSVVVKTAPSTTIEFHWAPFMFPGCGGCLCRDSSWSCSGDTHLDDHGRALTLAPEAGFLQIDGGPYTAENQSRMAPTHRVWYSFQPASSSPHTKPLAVFFNGGPGSSTSGILMVFNTGPTTLDPQRTSGPASNPYSWTEFANLLYIDGPGTGFSYSVPLPSGEKPPLGTDMDRDAGNFLRVVLRFLERHPAIQGNEVVLVGESYGGLRSSLMIDYLYNYASLLSGQYRDSSLYADLTRYFSAVFGQTQPTAAQIATKFGHRVLIQPGLFGAYQTEMTPITNMPGCLSPNCGFNNLCDLYQCDNDNPKWSDELCAQAAARLAELATFKTVLGVEPGTIEWIKPAARRTAYGRPDSRSVIVPTGEMENTWGALTEDDNYFVAKNGYVVDEYVWNGKTACNTRSTTCSERLGLAFLNSLANVKTFITNAKYDGAIYVQAIGFAISRSKVFLDLGWNAGYVGNHVSGLDRPGTLEVWRYGNFVTGIAMPSYLSAGHSVSIRMPQELRNDVMSWYAANR